MKSYRDLSGARIRCKYFCGVCFKTFDTGEFQHSEIPVPCPNNYLRMMKDYGYAVLIRKEKSHNCDRTVGCYRLTKSGVGAAEFMINKFPELYGKQKCSD